MKPLHTVLLFLLFIVSSQADCYYDRMISPPTPALVSTLNCNEIMAVEFPFVMNWVDGTTGLMANGKHIGFTMALPSKYGGIYAPQKVDIHEPGWLSLTSSSGFFDTRNMGNALGVGIPYFLPSMEISVTLKLPQGNGRREQVGLWFGGSEMEYIKLALISVSPGDYNLEVKYYSNGLNKKWMNIELINIPTQVTLWMKTDIRRYALYTYISLTDTEPEFSKQLIWRFDYVSREFFGNGDYISDEMGTTTFAGIYAARGNNVMYPVFNFSDFAIYEIDFPPDGCLPSPNRFLPPRMNISPESCTTISPRLNLNTSLNFDGDYDGLTDELGVGTGFTMYLPAEEGSSYVASNIHTANGILTISPTPGLAHGVVTTLDNNLGLPLSPNFAQNVSVFVVNPPSGTEDYEQAGLMVGVSQRNYVKMVAISYPGDGANLSFQALLRVNGVTQETTTLKRAIPGANANHPGVSALLTITTNPFTNTLSCYYNGLLLDSFQVPAEWFSVAQVDPNIGTNIYGCVFASTRNRDPQLPVPDYKFGNFSIFSM